MDLRELVVAYGEAMATIVNEGEMGTMQAMAAATAEADRLLGELDRRIALAEADHVIMWRSHLDDNARSVDRQRALLRNVDLDEARGWGRGLAERYVQADLVDEHRKNREASR